MEKKLTKSRKDKKLCGVCGGVANYFNCDSTIIRLGTALLALCWGVGIPLYIIAAIIMPFEDAVE